MSFTRLTFWGNWPWYSEIMGSGRSREHSLVSMIWFGGPASVVAVRLQFLLHGGCEVSYLILLSTTRALSSPSQTSSPETLVQTKPFPWHFPPDLVWTKFCVKRSLGVLVTTLKNAGYFSDLWAAEKSLDVLRATSRKEDMRHLAQFAVWSLPIFLKAGWPTKVRALEAARAQPCTDLWWSCRGTL